MWSISGKKQVQICVDVRPLRRVSSSAFETSGAARGQWCVRVCVYGGKGLGGTPNKIPYQNRALYKLFEDTALGSCHSRVPVNCAQHPSDLTYAVFGDRFGWRTNGY